MSDIPHIGLFALVLILVSVMRWFWRTWRVDIPKNPILYKAAWGSAFFLGCFAYYQSPEDPYAGWAIGLGLLMLYLVSTGRQRVGDESINVGDLLPSFSAFDENGDKFDSASLDGQPVLLKFFRGHW
jgi:hypothetical protein